MIKDYSSTEYLAHKAKYGNVDVVECILLDYEPMVNMDGNAISNSCKQSGLKWNIATIGKVNQATKQIDYFISDDIKQLPTYNIFTSIESLPISKIEKLDLKQQSKLTKRIVVDRPELTTWWDPDKPDRVNARQKREFVRKSNWKNAKEIYNFMSDDDALRYHKDHIAGRLGLYFIDSDGIIRVRKPSTGLMFQIAAKRLDNGRIEIHAFKYDSNTRSDLFYGRDLTSNGSLNLTLANRIISLRDHSA